MEEFNDIPNINRPIAFRAEPVLYTVTLFVTKYDEFGPADEDEEKVFFEVTHLYSDADFLVICTVNGEEFGIKKEQVNKYQKQVAQ